MAKRMEDTYLAFMTSFQFEMRQSRNLVIQATELTTARDRKKILIWVK